MARRQQVVVLPKGLKFFRNRANLTQVELAKEVGCSETLIALIETGRRQPGLENAEAIAAAVGVDLDTFAFIGEELEAVHRLSPDLGDDASSTTTADAPAAAPAGAATTS